MRASFTFRFPTSKNGSFKFTLVEISCNEPYTCLLADILYFNINGSTMYYTQRKTYNNVITDLNIDRFILNLFDC